MPDYATEIQRKRKRWGALKTERSSWFAHWQELGRFLLPRAGRFLATDRNRGGKKHNHIYDSHATRALRVLSAGLMAGMTSPARPWFRLKTPDNNLNEAPAVKAWLAEVTKRMRHIFNASNSYRALHQVYKNLGAFGTASNIIEADFEFVIHNTPLAIGEYGLAVNGRGMVDTLYREYEMTVYAIVDAFGLENVSNHVRNLYDTGKGLDATARILHVIEPRVDRDPTKRDPRNMPWKSCYLEYGDNQNKYLRESGYKRFPAVCPRWELETGDVYGESPGMEALGDTKQLQHEQLRKGQAIDFMTQPPLQVPSSMKGRGVEGMPGGVNYVDSTASGAGIRSAFDVDLRLDHLLQDVQDVRQRISRAFYEDLFLMIANDTRSNITATEIAERHEEKLLMLGPVLERLHNELLSPLIDVVFDRMVEVGIVPPPPQELQGRELEVEFVSLLAQAQQAVGLASVDRLLGTVGNIAAVKPDILDKIDTDQVVDVYADMLGVDPSLIVADENVVIIRAQRAEQQAAAQQAAMLPEMAKTAKTLADADTGGKNALTDALRLTGGA